MTYAVKIKFIILAMKLMKIFIIKIINTIQLRVNQTRSITQFLYTHFQKVMDLRVGESVIWSFPIIY